MTAGVGADSRLPALVAGEHEAEVDLMPEMIAQYAYDALVGLASTGYWQYDRQVKSGDFDVPAKITPVRLITREVLPAGAALGPLAGAAGGRTRASRPSKTSRNRTTRARTSRGKTSRSRASRGRTGRTSRAGIARDDRSRTSRVAGKQPCGSQPEDGKTVEVQIDGEIKKIETMDGTAGGGQGGSQGGSQGEGS